MKTELMILTEIRAAVGDPEGKLMQDELLARVKAIVAENIELKRRDKPGKVSGPINHTPGPWRIEEMSDGMVVATRNEEFFHVADVRGWGALQYQKVGEAEFKANGNLIAAAPDLLAALVGMRECYSPGFVLVPKEKETAAHIAAMKAISLAKGGIK